jgi:Flp pilus assembly protein TadG
MARFKIELHNNGQALTEMLLVIPLLCLLLAGTIQFTILFQARSAFDQACGNEERKYAANLTQDSASITEDIWKNLGSYQTYFNKSSIKLDVQAPQPSAASVIFNALGNLGPLADKVKSYFINYTGQSWTVTINCTPPALMAFLFPNGIPFKSQFTVLKYPSQEHL